MKTYNPYPLPIKVSSRITINEEESKKLITTYNQQIEEENLLNIKLGINKSAFYKMVKGRDSISIPFLLKVQSVFGIDIVSKERLTESCREYMEFIFNK